MTSVDAAAAAAILADVEAYVAQYLTLRISSFLDRAEGELADSWAGIADPGEKLAAREATRLLRRQKDAISTRHFDRLMASLRRAAAQSSVDLSFLTLIDKEGLDIVVVRANLVSKVMATAQGEAAELAARLDTLQACGANNNPQALMPGSLVDAFQETLSEFGVASSIQAAIINVFGDTGLAYIKRFYAELNRLLAERGIGAELAVVKQQSARQRTHLSAAEIMRMLEGRLGQLPGEIDQWTQHNLQPGALRRIVDAYFDAQSEAELTASQMRDIARIEAIFIDFLNDERISARVREQLGRLIVPLLIKRLRDPGAFELANSPVRAFVRQLAALGTLDARNPISEFDRVVAFVGRIVAENGLDTHSFRSGAQLLYSLLHRRPQHEAGEAQAAPTNCAEDKARQIVQQELDRLAAGLSLSEPVRAISQRLLSPWMVACCECYGADSVSWEKARTTAEQFFGSLRADPELDPAEAEELRRKVKRHVLLLAQRARLGQSATQALIQALQQHYAKLDTLSGLPRETLA